MTTTEKRTSSTDEQSVRAALDNQYTAWAAGDADAFAANYIDDATVCLQGVFNQGKDAVRDYMAAGFAGPLRGSTVVDNPVSVRLFGDTAIVVSKGGVLMPGEQTLPTEREVLATWVLVRDGGDWQVASYHNCAAHR